MCGKVSGNLEQIDFDRQADVVYREWQELVESESPGLVARLAVIRTPREPAGYRAVYRCEVAVSGNTALAREPVPNQKTGRIEAKAIIETRGEGGYAVLPGSPNSVHETGRPYLTVQGDLCELPVLTAEEREILLRCARAFDQWEAYVSSRTQANTSTSTRRTKDEQQPGLLPGEDFDRRGPDWAELLEPHGWCISHRCGEKVYWRRPDKDDPGHSATTGHCTGKEGEPLLYVFSSNGYPFEGGKAYGRFRAYALLNHNGDFRAAARELGQRGYGEQRKNAPRPTIGSASDRDGGAPPEDSEGPRGPGRFMVDRLELCPGRPRLTPSGKVSLPVSVRDGAEHVSHFQLTSTLSSHRDPARLLQDHLADGVDRGPEIRKTFGLLLAWGAREAQRPPGEDDAPTVAELLAEKAPPAWGFTHRTERGELWSETRGRSVCRGEFVGSCPSWLIETVGVARDVPRSADGCPVRPDLIRAIQSEMVVLWSDLMERLPEAAAADLGACSEAGRRFREAVVALWTRPETFEVQKVPGGGDTAARASLASRVRRQEREEMRSNAGWHRIAGAFDAWWRGYLTADGEARIALAMRWTLAVQMRTPLPGVHDERSLSDVGRSLGVLDLDPKANQTVPDMTSGGRERLAVLLPDLVDEILSQPMEDIPTDLDQPTEAG